MGFLGIGNKDSEGRQVRIEHRGEHLRASRTGGIALREQIRAGGLSLTANTQRGTRISMTPARNTQVAFQNSRFVLRGRYGKGPAKLNLSKSGVSLSGKMGLGTINFTNPGRSSAKIAGVQMRGQKAAAINGVVALFQMLVMLVRLTIAMLGYLIVGTLNLAIWLSESSAGLIAYWRFQRQQKRRATRTRRLEEAAQQWIASNHGLLAGLTPESAMAAMESLLAQASENSGASDTEADRAGSAAEGCLGLLLQRLSRVDGPDSETDEPSARNLPVTGMAALAVHYRDSVSQADLPSAFYRLDEFALDNGTRTIGQELMLEDVADLFGLRLEIMESGEPS
ncbi:hypothetical protein [Wenzhouxiangella sediminis]|uniref:Uncharacterized protein n=1 Tax=Wenzhouxiangella sediminis TaxID=1792836 RepID=A0A3E1K605_9GAMM|nr:hypothetical protein [Wenzhouxiangella sediminis]RFF29398.1 hypothetical protein DZC52_13210 [Wenzhouxiangella sediminis]